MTVLSIRSLSSGGSGATTTLQDVGVESPLRVVVVVMDKPFAAKEALPGTDVLHVYETMNLVRSASVLTTVVAPEAR